MFRLFAESKDIGDYQNRFEAIQAAKERSKGFNGLLTLKEYHRAYQQWLIVGKYKYGQIVN